MLISWMRSVTPRATLSGRVALRLDGLETGASDSFFATRERPQSCSGAFSLYDVDKDGYITKKEMVDIVDAIYTMVGKEVFIVDRKK